jgi:hypothetical protein
MTDMLAMNVATNLDIHMQYGSRQLVSMRRPDALKDLFRAACLASCYFGGGLIKVNDWAPGLTLRVAMFDGPWLTDLPHPDDAVQTLNKVADLFNRNWMAADYDIRTWLSNPRQPPAHHVSNFGQTTVCWSDRVIRAELPAMILDACWPGLRHPSG